MDTVLLILLLAVLAGVSAVAWMLRTRMRELEARLKGFEPLGELPDRLGILAERLEQMEPGEIRAEVGRIRAGLERVEALVAVPTAARAETAEPTRPEIVRAAVTRYLVDEGYRSIQVVDADENLDGDPVKVRVESVRQGLQVKGTVTVEGDRITETSLDPSYAMFP